MKRTLTGMLVAVALAVFAVRCQKPSPTVSEIVVTGTFTFTHKGVTSQLTAVANKSSGNPEVVTTTAHWSSDNPAVATVSSTGVITTVGNGAANITAEYQGKVGGVQALVTLQGNPAITSFFQRRCTPNRAYIQITVAETNNDIGFNITGLTVQFLLFGVVKATHTFTNGEFLTAFSGSTHFNAGQSKVITFETSYSGGVSTEDSNAVIDGTFTDDLGRALTVHATDNVMHDGC